MMQKERDSILTIASARSNSEQEGLVVTKASCSSMSVTESQDEHHFLRSSHLKAALGNFLGYPKSSNLDAPMLRNWHVFWSDPDGKAGVAPVSARSLEHACQVVLELHPGARVSAIDTEVMDPTWMPSLMVDWLQDWEDDFTP